MTDSHEMPATIKLPTTDTTPKPRRRYHRTYRHYFVVEGGHLREIDRDHMEKAWQGDIFWDEPDCDLRIISVIHDDTESFYGCYFARVAVVAGKITDESQHEANCAGLNHALQRAWGDRQLEPNYLRQVVGWPNDWAAQIAQALNVPITTIHDKGVGGPLLTSSSMGVSIVAAARMCAEVQRLKPL